MVTLQKETQLNIIQIGSKFLVIHKDYLIITGGAYKLLMAVDKEK